jgi:hypothetical protein
MTWRCYQLTFHAESDISIGFYKLGFVQRTRYYLPARNLWAATTEAMTLLNTGPDKVASWNDFKNVGDGVDKTIRFSYFFPRAEDRVHIPRLPDDGISGGEPEADILFVNPEDFESLFVDSRVRTAVNPANNSAQDEGLFEVEFIRAKGSAGSICWVGYVWLNEGRTIEEMGRVLARISVGGERCYGMGKLRLGSASEASKVFGLMTGLAGVAPTLQLPSDCPIPAHLAVRGCKRPVHGEIEPLTGRVWAADSGPGRDFDKPVACWAPGSIIKAAATTIVGSKGILFIASPDTKQGQPNGS